MKTKLFAATIALVLIGNAVLAQKQSATVTKQSTSLVSALPQSDALAIVNVNQLLTEVAPKMLADNPVRLAEMNAEIDKFKTRTGIDPRAFDQLALGLRYTYPGPGISKIESVALARGTFSAAAIVAAGRIAANGKYREEKYQGQTIYVFGLDQQMKVFGLFNLKVSELAVSALSKNVLALGNLNTVKAAIDTGKGPRRLNQELIELALRDPNAAIGFGGKLTPELLNTLNLPNDAIAKDVSTIRQVYGSVAVTAKDVEMFLAARTVNPEAAKNLSGTLEGLRALAGLFVGQIPAPKRNLARTALDNLKVTTQGNELYIRSAVAQADIASLLRAK